MLDAETSENPRASKPDRVPTVRPLLIGVAGGSGSGKTTFAKMLQEHIGVEKCGIIYQDSYYFDQSESFTGDGSINYDHPNSLDFSLLAAHLQNLASGEAVKLPIYDFKTHKRSSQFVIQTPKPVIVVDGILIFSQKNVVECLDQKVFVDTRESIRYDRRLKRDVAERGRTAKGVRAQFEAHVKPMHDQFVEPSKKFANTIVSGEEAFDESLTEFIKKMGL